MKKIKLNNILLINASLLSIISVSCSYNEKKENSEKEKFAKEYKSFNNTVKEKIWLTDILKYEDKNSIVEIINNVEENILKQIEKTKIDNFAEQLEFIKTEIHKIIVNKVIESNSKLLDFLKKSNYAINWLRFKNNSNFKDLDQIVKLFLNKETFLLLSEGLSFLNDLYLKYFEKILAVIAEYDLVKVMYNIEDNKYELITLAKDNKLTPFIQFSLNDYDDKSKILYLDKQNNISLKNINDISEITLKKVNKENTEINFVKKFLPNYDDKKEILNDVIIDNLYSDSILFNKLEIIDDGEDILEDIEFAKNKIKFSEIINNINFENNSLLILKNKFDFFELDYINNSTIAGLEIPYLINENKIINKKENVFEIENLKNVNVLDRINYSNIWRQLSNDIYFKYYYLISKDMSNSFVEFKNLELEDYYKNTANEFPIK
ncbi:Uncharacterised protein [Mycoplasmopsis maculosa]|uniref:Lipoprotein n=1 Tax=Mycoplasmopsis maculosa TaxID=114885 RepID=A0A449B586_9BACT|nr:hypothetical protein [Mycoplasmopsis maculosa]VEU75688.1 Uncharacterised protein [Mycoplasmopsis maculosa]